MCENHGLTHGLIKGHFAKIKHTAGGEKQNGITNYNINTKKNARLELFPVLWRFQAPREYLNTYASRA